MVQSASPDKHPLRFRDVVNLAAPSSWAASVMPSILAIALGYLHNGRIDALMAVCLFIAAVMMQSAVNAFNDYADFIKGTDTLENSPDATDAVIVYGMNPKTARNLGIAFLVLAFAAGMVGVIRTGLVPLVIGLIGAGVIWTYSMGRLPVSYLPIGELVSGFVMGGLIPLAGYSMQTKVLDWSVLLYALPLIIGIGMIMFSNNGCDIDRDRPAGRHTLAVILGHAKTTVLYRFMLAVWLCSPFPVLALLGKPGSMLVYLLEIPVMLFGLMRQFTFRLGPEQRGMVMGGIANLNIMLAFAYIVALLIR